MSEKGKKRKLAPQKKKAEGGRERKEHFWAPNVTLKLIELVKLHYSRIKNKRERQSAWFDIWNVLKEDDSELTLKQVDKKWRNLQHSYNLTIERIQKLGKDRVKLIQCFDELHEILGIKPLGQNAMHSEQYILPLLPTESGLETPVSSGNVTFQMENVLNSPIITEISEASNNVKTGTSKHPYSGIESAINDLIHENRKVVSNEQKKIEVMEKDSDQRKDFNDGVLSAINRRTEILDRQQSSTLKIENILLMTQRYDDKLDKLDNKIIKLENGMGRIESKIERYLDNL